MTSCSSLRIGKFAQDAVGSDDPQLYNLSRLLRQVGNVEELRLSCSALVPPSAVLLRDAEVRAGRANFWCPIHLVGPAFIPAASREGGAVYAVAPVTWRELHPFFNQRVDKAGQTLLAPELKLL